MTSIKAKVKFTASFEANLAEVELFWRERDAIEAYGILLLDLGRAVIGNLEQHPLLGRRFLARSAQSLEVAGRVAKLRQRLGSMDLREYLAGDYLILYGVESKAAGARQASTVHLLAIRHHRELSFDFDAFWRAGHPSVD